MSSSFLGAKDVGRCSSAILTMILVLILKTFLNVKVALFCKSVTKPGLIPRMVCEDKPRAANEL